MATPAPPAPVIIQVPKGMTTLTLTPEWSGPVTPPPPSGTVKFGASLGPVPSTHASIKAWETKTALPLAVRHYFSPSIKTGYAAGPFNGEAGVRRILCDIEPAHDGSDAGTLDTWLGEMAQAGLEMDFTIFHAMPSKGFANPAAYAKALEPYVPLVKKHGFRHVYDLNSYQDVHDGLLATWWPGDSVAVDAIGIEYYVNGYKAGQRLDASAAFADSKKVAFGLTEFGMNFGAVATEAEGNDMIGYIHSLYSTRILAGKACYDIVLWSNVAGNTAPGYEITNQPETWITGYQGLAALLATA